VYKRQEFIFFGFQRNTPSIKGTEGVDICWLEEAESLTRDQWTIIEPTIRKENSECWIIYNPHMVDDFVEQNFVDSIERGILVKIINYPENPFLSEKMLKTISISKSMDEEEYQHIYLGVPYTDDDMAVIKRSWIEVCIDAHIKLGVKLSGITTVGYDVADSGEDTNATATFDGAICKTIDEWKAPEDALVESTMRAWSHVGDGRLIYDSIGVGAHVGSTLKGKGINSNYDKFNAGSTVAYPDSHYSKDIKNKDKFENLKAQSWQVVADRFRNTFNAITKGKEFSPEDLISISSDCEHLEMLKKELSLPHKSFSKRGYDMVESKDQLKKRGFKSPNLADAFIMGASLQLVTSKAAKGVRVGR